MCALLVVIFDFGFIHFRKAHQGTTNPSTLPFPHEIPLEIQEPNTALRLFWVIEEPVLLFRQECMYVAASIVQCAIQNWLL